MNEINTKTDQNQMDVNWLERKLEWMKWENHQNQQLMIEIDIEWIGIIYIAQLVLIYGLIWNFEIKT